MSARIPDWLLVRRERCSRWVNVGVSRGIAGCIAAVGVVVVVAIVRVQRCSYGGIAGVEVRADERIALARAWKSLRSDCRVASGRALWRNVAATALPGSIVPD